MQTFENRTVSINTEPQVFDLLHLLIRHAGILVTRDQIIDEIWGGRIVSESSISARINAARNAVGDNGKEQAVVKTVPRRGFKFVQVVTKTDARNEEFETKAADTASPIEVRGSPEPTIAILPFKNFSPKRQDDFFAEGIAEDITTEISRFSALNVISRMSSFGFRNEEVDHSQIGQALGADFILTGSVRRTVDRLRLGVALADTRSGSQVWAERYDRPIDDIFSVMDEISEVIASTLVGRVQKNDLQRIQSRKSTNLTAYEFLLKGLDIHKSGDVTAERAKEAVRAFTSAIQKEPNMARAYAWRACAYSRTWSFPALESEFEICSADVSKALELDPSDAEAHRIAGALCRFSQKFERSDYHIGKAMEFNPNDANIVIKAAEHHAFMGRREKARELCNRAMKLNPMFPEWYWEIVSLADYAEGDFVSALKHAKIPSTPTYAGLAYRAVAEMQLGLPEEARNSIVRLKSLFPNISIDVFERGKQRFSFLDKKTQDKFIVSLEYSGL